MYWRMRKTPKAVTSIGPITSRKSAFRPGKRSFAKANPASALKKTTESVTTEATIAELISAVQKLTLTSPESKSRVRLCQSWVPRVRTVGYAATAELSCDATTRDQYSGKIEMTVTRP